MLYFRNYPRTAYIFGDEATQGSGEVKYEIYQDISRYSDIVDQIKDDVSFYKIYSIRENDRPDQLSFRLYGTPEYHWTFYMLNDKLRERGWPLTMKQLEDVVKRDYPHYTFTTTQEMTGFLTVGQIAVGATSGARGRVLRRNLDLGQITVQAQKSFLQGEQVRSVAATGDASGSVTANFVALEYLAVHHYENADKEWTDIDYRSGPGSQLTAITNYDRYVEKNNELRDIKIIKPNLIQEISSAYFQSIKS